MTAMIDRSFFIISVEANRYYIIVDVGDTALDINLAGIVLGFTGGGYR